LLTATVPVHFSH